MSKRYKKLVHEGEYAAEVEVELIMIDEGWSPYLSWRMQSGSIRCVKRFAAAMFVLPAGRPASIT